MNAIPMLARCAEAQWRGLREQDRVRINTLWDCPNPFTPTLLHQGVVPQISTPIWRVVSLRRGGLDLMSVKDDYLGDIASTLR